METDKFKKLFKKYRLKAEFSTLSELSLSLAEKGLLYEESIFSHWQKGARIPQSRNILIKLIEIFVEKEGMTTLAQANEFLSSAGQGYLSEEEMKNIPKLHHSIFQVPHEIANFCGREEIFNTLLQTDISGKVILLHGPAGVGKTALAIKLGHLLKDRFSDGVLWYKVEKDNLMDILLSIALIFGEQTDNIHNLQVRATIVRALLASKNVLLVLDSAELCDDIYLLIPNSQSCTTLLTSQKNYLKTPILYIDIPVNVFTDMEVLILFREVMKEKYSQNSANTVLQTTRRVGNLPLAVHILARQLKHVHLPITQLPNLLDEEPSLIQELHYEDKNLYAAFTTSYEKLDTKTKSVLVSASIFKGKDFSSQSIAYINGFPTSSAINILNNLVDLSLVERSTKSRYRLHPTIQEFVRDKLDHPRSSYLSFIAIGIFLFLTAWWIYMQLFKEKSDVMYNIFAVSYCILAFYGGIFGIQTSFKWGGLKTILGKAICMFSIGLLLQVFGQLAYSYRRIYLPSYPLYPSVGDIGFFGTIPFYIYGALLLAQSSGIKLNFHSFKKKIIALFIPLVMLTIAYLLFLRDYVFDFTNPIKVFLDFGYPLGEAISISIAIITFIFSRTILDGIMRSKAFFVLIALVIMFIADYTFILTTDIFYPGNFIDFIYLVAYFTMTIALLHLKSIRVNVRSAES